ncbi:MAG: hypothetical protein QXW81_01995 [Archaeoglobaceae archaeon]
MRFEVALALLITLLTLAEGKTEVYITVDKEKVAIGDSIHINVSISIENAKPIEILVSGMGEGYWLCKSESAMNLTDACGKSEWEFRIPEDWLEGDYVVKVNIEDTPPWNFSSSLRL